MPQIKLKIITPERVVFEELVDQVVLPTTEGEITILPEHIPLVSMLGSGDVVARANNEDIPFALVGGFVEVNRGTTPDAITEISVLADFAEHVTSLTETEIEKAKARAEELQKQKDNKEVVDFEHFASELARSLTRAKIGDKWRNKKYRM